MSTFVTTGGELTSSNHSSNGPQMYNPMPARIGAAMPPATHVAKRWVRDDGASSTPTTPGTDEAIFHHCALDSDQGNTKHETGCRSGGVSLVQAAKRIKTASSQRCSTGHKGEPRRSGVDSVEFMRVAVEIAVQVSRHADR